MVYFGTVKVDHLDPLRRRVLPYLHTNEILCADLANLQKRCETICLWSGFSRFSMVDSYGSRRFPRFRLKNCRTFTLFTTWLISQKANEAGYFMLSMTFTACNVLRKRYQFH